MFYSSLESLEQFNFGFQHLKEVINFAYYLQCCLGSPAFDLAHFMFSSVQSHLRKNNWEYLLDVYFETFCETVKALKGDFKFCLEVRFFQLF